MLALRKELAPICILILAGLYSVWPEVLNRNLVPNVGSDVFLLTWIMHQPLLSFQGNIFYPYKNVLAYSDMHKISAAITGGNFAVAMIFGQVATMLVVYFWWRKWGQWPAVVGTVVLALSQIRFEYRVHLQMWSMQYWLAAVGLIIYGLNKSKSWLLYLGFGILGLQIYESPLPILFSAALLVIYGLINKTKVTKPLVLAMVLFSIIIFPAVRVYRGVSQEFNFVRDIREAAHNSISVDDLWGHFWSPGLVVLLAVAHLKNRHDSKFLLTIFAIGLIMSLGPVLKWQGQTVKFFGKYFVPLPYGIVYYVVPGMGGFRTPSRWLWLSAFAASGIIAAGINRRYALCLGVAIIGGTRLMNVVQLPDVPAVYQWLKTQPGRVVLEIPVYTWPQEKYEVERMYFSLYHGKTLVNGYSGFTPPLVYKLTADPKNNIPAGVDYIISHDPKVRFSNKILYADEKDIVYSAR